MLMGGSSSSSGVITCISEAGLIKDSKLPKVPVEVTADIPPM
jgi:hypothetical protein